MDNLMISVVTNLNILQVQLGQNLLPVLAGDESGSVHDAAVRDDEHILGALLRHGEVCLLQSHHGDHQVLLEVKHLKNYKLNLSSYANYSRIRINLTAITDFIKNLFNLSFHALMDNICLCLSDNCVIKGTFISGKQYFLAYYATMTFNHLVKNIYFFKAISN